MKTLPYYREFFSLAYPLPKCDLVAVQNFAMGAMENWGCITFRETALLVDPDNSSAAGRQRVALVVGEQDFFLNIFNGISDIEFVLYRSRIGPHVVR